MVKSAVTACVTCGTHITQQLGRGRAKLYCDRGCWPRHEPTEPRSCACGNRIRRDNESGLCATCKPRGRATGPTLERTCKTCSTPFTTTNATKIYCSPGCRQIKRPARSRPSSTDRGYGSAHKRLRQVWKQRVLTGNLPCCLCDRPIDPTEPWHLDHTEDRKDYRGAAHQLCNLREGQRRSAMTVLANHYGVERNALAAWLEAGGPPKFLVA